MGGAKPTASILRVQFARHRSWQQKCQKQHGRGTQYGDPNKSNRLGGRPSPAPADPFGSRNRAVHLYAMVQCVLAWRQAHDLGPYEFGNVFNARAESCDRVHAPTSVVLHCGRDYK